MYSADVPLSRTDFETINWQKVADETVQKSCYHFYVRSFAEAENCRSAGDILGERVFTQLAVWTQPRLENENAPYAEATLELNSPDDFSLLRELAPTTLNAELRARLADLAWHGRFERKRDPDMARLAITSYLEAFEAFTGEWWEQAPRVERAMVLALSLGRSGSETETVLAFIQTKLAEMNGIDDGFLSERLMALLQEQMPGRGDAAAYSVMAGSIAIQAESSPAVGHWGKARRYWQIKAGWHAQESPEWFDALQKAAETHFAEAEDQLYGRYGVTQPMAAAHHLQRAIAAYRSIIPHSQFQTRMDDLHKQMIEVNRDALKTFKTFTSAPVDISDYSSSARNAVEGKSFFAAIGSLVLLYDSPSLDSLRRQVVAGTSEFVELIAAHHKVNRNGQVVARRPSLLSSDPAEREQAVVAQMFTEGTKHRDLFVKALLLPALDQIRSEHHITTRDWVHLVRDSPFIPPDRLLLFARGFQSGWEQEWDISTHLLVPQVENSIRYLLTENGSLASALHSTGIQSEQGLDQTLQKPALSEILPEEIIFDLRGLLTEQMGDYFRHMTSHGLASFVEFYSAPSLYLWWLTLRLSLLPLLSGIPDLDAGSVEETDTVHKDNAP